MRDDGRGLPSEMIKGLGLELVETLVTDDLHGRIKFQSAASGGTEISIRLARTIESGE
ncbi:MAG: ATP-binding protein [Anaerolineae bacterium]|nr:ATP-binding protein [Anaerolineae bacterium]